jgi:regulatory protein
MSINDNQSGEVAQDGSACALPQEKTDRILALEAMLREHLHSHPQQLKTRSARNVPDHETSFSLSSPETHDESIFDRVAPENGLNPPGKERSLSARAFDALSRREYSRQELMRKLGPWAENETVLLQLLDKLQVEGYLSDQRYVYARLHAKQTRYGSQKILYELRTQGIDEPLLIEAAATLQVTEMERARAVWEKKFNELPHTQADRAKQWRYLQTRGFATDIIRRVIRGDDKDQ